MSPMRRHLFLIGLPGVGKSYTQRLLSQRLGMCGVDVDECIEHHLGVDISWIFDCEGEQGFRRYETQMLHTLLKKPEPSIISGGGGIVLVKENRVMLEKYAVVVYLKAKIAHILQRFSDAKRPMFQGVDVQTTMHQLEKERAFLYESCADFVLEVDQKKALAHLINFVSSLQIQDRSA